MEYQQKFNIDRTRWLLNHYPLIGKGHNWCDLTQDAVEELILHEDSIRRFCRYAHCPDELYKQIILLNSSNMNVKKFVPHDIRFIDWSVGESHPKPIRNVILI